MSIYSHRITVTPSGGQINGRLEVEDLQATGSLLGTASYALSAGSVAGTIQSASYALTASYVLGASVTSSYSLSSSWSQFAVDSDNTISSSYALSSSVSHTSQTASLATSVLLYDVASGNGYINDTQAAAGGVPIGGLYRNGNFIQIRIS